MAAHLEAHPNAKAVVNFAPVLLVQIDEYLKQIDQWRQSGTPFTDPLLAALVQEKPTDPLSPEDLELVKMCQIGRASCRGRAEGAGVAAGDEERAEAGAE